MNKTIMKHENITIIEKNLSNTNDKGRCQIIGAILEWFRTHKTIPLKLFTSIVEDASRYSQIVPGEKGNIADYLNVNKGFVTKELIVNPYVHFTEVKNSNVNIPSWLQDDDDDIPF